MITLSDDRVNGSTPTYRAIHALIPSYLSFSESKPTMNRRPTIMDVAALAGVALKTVY
jgi:hypothetical protein